MTKKETVRILLDMVNYEISSADNNIKICQLFSLAFFVFSVS